MADSKFWFFLSDLLVGFSGETFSPMTSVLPPIVTSSLCAQNFLFPCSFFLLRTVFPVASFIFSIQWSTVLGAEKGWKGCSLLEIWLQFLGKKRVRISWKGQWIVEVFPEKQFIWEMTTWLNCSSHCATQSETLKPSPVVALWAKNDHFIWKLWDVAFLEVSYLTLCVLWASVMYVGKHSHPYFLWRSGSLCWGPDSILPEEQARQFLLAQTPVSIWW